MPPTTAKKAAAKKAAAAPPTADDATRRRLEDANRELAARLKEANRLLEESRANPPAAADPPPSHTGTADVDEPPKRDPDAEAALAALGWRARPEVGKVVTHTQFDHYAPAGGADVVRYGLVVAVGEDEDGTEGARIMWLDALSDPVRLDELSVVE